MHSFLKRILLTCVYLTVSLAAFGQTARFSGQITDPQNAAISKAEVEVFNLETLDKASAKTSDAGTYVVPYLPAGQYRIQVQVPGFAPYTSNPMTLGMGQAFIYNVQLTVGSTQSTVTVNGNSEVTQIDTENAEVSGTITGKEVQGIQLNGRNFSQLIALAPGVSNQTQQDEARIGMAGSVAYSVNGGRTEYNSFQVDGSETLNVGINKDHSTLIVTPSIDAIQEIKVLTSNYGAQYPSTGNGTTIVTTKSGTDQYHGSVYEFFRNEAFNAKGYFDVGNRAPLYRRNDFGGTIGGPLSIPHLYDAKGKTHFFFSEEARIEKDPYAYRQAVPSLAERSGDFSDVCPAASNNFGGVAFSRTKYPDCPTGGIDSNGTLYTYPNNQITYNTNSVTHQLEPTPLNQSAVALLSTGIFPLPNASSGCNSSLDTTIGHCFNGEVSLPTYWREELFRIDHAINSKWQVGFRYIHDEWDETTPVPQYASTQNTFPTIQNRFYAPGTSYMARLTGAISPTFLNEFIASYTNSHITLADVAGSGVSLARPAALDLPCTSGVSSSSCGINTIFDNGSKGTDGVAKIPGVAIAGNNAEYGGYGFATDPGYMPWEHSNPTYSFADNLTKTLRRHNFQFGAQWVVFQRNQTNGPIGAASGDTQGLITESNISSGGGNSFAQFLLGDASTYQQDSAQARYRQRYQIVEPYFQDDWKVTQRLTVNLGLRLSLFGTFHELNNNAWNWEPSAFSTTTANQSFVDGGGGLRSAGTGTPVPIYESDGSVNPLLLNGMVQCGKDGRPSGCMSGHLFNPAPRVGFAWDPTGGGKTVLRGGYGIFFEHGTADEANTGSLEGAAPNVLSMTQLNTSFSSIGETYSHGTAAYQPVAFPLNVTAIPSKAVWPYVQQWSASIEHELPGNALATFAYVGSKGTHLTAELETNQLQPASSNPYGAHEPMITKGANPAYGKSSSSVGDCSIGGTSANRDKFILRNGTAVAPSDAIYNNLVVACYAAVGSITTSTNTYGISPNSLRTYAPGIGEIHSLQNVANSSYHAFQATLRKVQGPLTLGVAYTYSHSLDNASDRSDATFVNSFNLKGNRASSNFDQRHLLHINYIYDLPLLKFFDTFLHAVDDANTPESRASWQNSHVVKAVLDGWQLSGLTIFETGIPFTVVNNGSPAGISALDNAGVANGVGSGSYPDLSGISAKSRRPAGGNNKKSVGPLLLNPAAFIAPRGLTFGNAGRNDLNNPSRWNSDMAMLKHFPVFNQMNAEFRAEAFNVFNVTQFRIYDPTLGNQAQNEVSCYGGAAAYYSAAGGDGTDCLTGSSFLHPVDAHRPRTVQFALKLLF